VISLAPSCVVQGTVHNDLGSGAGSPTGHGVVRLVASSGKIAGTTFLRKDGSFRFEGLSPGSYHLIVQVDDQTKEGESFEVYPDQPSVQSVHLP
jgi:hypothetical protein